MNGKSLKFFRKSHRNAGVALALFVLLLAVTGMLLNHTEGLRLSQRFVPPFVAGFYYQSQEVVGFKLDDHYYYSLDDTLFLDRQMLTRCAVMQGVVRLPDQFVVLCDAELILLTLQHQLIERIGAAYGLPVNLNQLAVEDGQLLLASDTAFFRFNTDSLTLEAVTTRFENTTEKQNIPVDLLLADSVSWQQFILDVHSGTFFGASGKWFADLLGLFIIGMAISGLVMWRNPR